MIRPLLVSLPLYYDSRKCRLFTIRRHPFALWENFSVKDFNIVPVAASTFRHKDWAGAHARTEMVHTKGAGLQADLYSLADAEKQYSGLQFYITFDIQELLTRPIEGQGAGNKKHFKFRIWVHILELKHRKG